MFKKSLTILLAVGLILSLGAGSLATEKIVVDYWIAWGMKDEAGHAWEKQMIAEFEKENPNIEIRKEFIPGSGSFEKVMLAIASGNTPDILEDYIARITPWWYEGVLVPLNDTLTEEEKEDFIPSLLDLHTIDGNLFAFPRFVWVNHWGGNKTLVERAGAAEFLPEGTEWDWDDFMQTVEKIAQLPETYPLVFWPGSGAHMLMNFQRFGASLYKDGDYTRTTLNSPEGVRALEWMLEMVEKGYAPKGVAGLGIGSALGMVQHGKVAFAYPPDPATMENVYSQGGLDYVADIGTWEVPVVEGVSAAPLYQAGYAMAVFKGPEQEAATKFVKFCLSRENLTSYMIHYEGAGFMTIRKSVPVSDSSMDIPLSIALKTGFADMGVNSPHGREVSDLLKVALEEAFSGMKTAKQALDDFAENVSELSK